MSDARDDALHEIRQRQVVVGVVVDLHLTIRRNDGVLRLNAVDRRTAEIAVCHDDTEHQKRIGALHRIRHSQIASTPHVGAAHRDFTIHA